MPRLSLLACRVLQGQFAFSGALVNVKESPVC